MASRSSAMVSAWCASGSTATLRADWRRFRSCAASVGAGGAGRDKGGTVAVTLAVVLECASEHDPLEGRAR